MQLRRFLAAPLVSALLACGGGGDSDSVADAKADAKDTTTSTAAAVDHTADQADISSKFTLFFDGANPDIAAKAAVLEDPVAMGAVLTKAAANPSISSLLGGATGRVESVTFDDAGRAQVSFNVLGNGQPLTPAPFTGEAVQVDGDWRITNATVCMLLGLADPSLSSEPGCAAG